MRQAKCGVFHWVYTWNRLKRIQSFKIGASNSIINAVFLTLWGVSGFKKYPFLLLLSICYVDNRLKQIRFWAGGIKWSLNVQRKFLFVLGVMFLCLISIIDTLCDRLSLVFGIKNTLKSIQAFIDAVEFAMLSLQIASRYWKTLMRSYQPMCWLGLGWEAIEFLAVST